MSQKAKCFTFYSYKGGSGRSTTLVNTVMHLAQMMDISEEQPILIIDADLESAGLTYLFDCENRFTHRFEKAIHTERLLTRYVDFQSASSDVYFGNEKEPLIDCKAAYERNDLLITYQPDIPTLLEGVKLYRSDLEHLQKILSAYCTCVSAKFLDTCDLETITLYKKYDLLPLIQLLKKIQAEPLSDADRLAKRQAAVEAFLPARSFVDISHFFGCPKNSVRFLGVDLAYHGEHQFAENASRKVISNFARSCGKRGYQAVLFDCGSGVQSTAHVLHMASDVLVYCMRPTQQFIKGTRTQLFNYRADLEASASTKQSAEAEQTEKKKPVILLPTAVPPNDTNTKDLQKSSFDSIKSIADAYRDIIDDYFCAQETCLREVSLFKWREFILGVKAPNSSKDSTLLDKYTSEDTMPADARAAFQTYKKLAERLLLNV